MVANTPTEKILWWALKTAGARYSIALGPLLREAVDTLGYNKPATPNRDNYR
jgi:hypothetical protein